MKNINDKDKKFAANSMFNLDYVLLRSLLTNSLGIQQYVSSGHGDLRWMFR